MIRGALEDNRELLKINKKGQTTEKEEALLRVLHVGGLLLFGLLAWWLM